MVKKMESTTIYIWTKKVINFDLVKVEMESNFYISVREMRGGSVQRDEMGAFTYYNDHIP